MTIDRYDLGSRMAWTLMLKTCLTHLGYNIKNKDEMWWISERESALNALRSVCGEFGDNDWDENLNLADIIDNHLEKHLLSEKFCK